MFPDQQNNNGGVNSTPQQGPNGQYEVVPPLPVSNNVGHSGHNPYEFIVNPNKPKSSRNPFGGTGNSFVMRIAAIVGGAVLLMILIALAVSAFAPKGSATGMSAVAERQQEIVRVATAASTQATSLDAKNFVATVQISVASSQQQVLGYLKSHGTKLGAKTLALDQSAQTDTLLANAATANNYDSAVTQNLTSQLQTYEELLQTTFKQTSSKSAKTLLQQCFTDAQKLVSQAQSVGS